MTIQSPLVYDLYNLASSERHLHHCTVAAIPVNPFCWSKSVKHDVTLTSLTADLLPMTWVLTF